MKKMLFAAVTALSVMLALSGCGGGSSPAPTFVTQILSDRSVDGDIRFDPPNTFQLSPVAPQTVFAGIDPVTGSEYRAFLDFPLTGAGGVPGNAFIDSATLDIFIDTIQPVSGSIPIRIELVSFPPPLQASDFDRTLQPPLSFTTILPAISGADVGRHVLVDVTSLMIEAQRRGVSNFQIRILEDFGFVSPGLIEIEDAITLRAPLLTVSYF